MTFVIISRSIGSPNAEFSYGPIFHTSQNEPIYETVGAENGSNG